MRVERFVHGGNVYEPCGEGRSWLDFSANINPLGLAEHVRTAILSQVEAVVHYPDPQARKLRAALSAHYEVSRARQSHHSDRYQVPAGGSRVALRASDIHRLRPRGR